MRYSNKENNTISTAYDSQIGSNTYEMDLADIYPPKIGFEGDKETRPINIAVKYFIFARLWYYFIFLIYFIRINGLDLQKKYIGVFIHY